MFSEIRQAILPLALRKLKRRGDLERAGLLIESLAKHWRDSKPFQLLIVAPRADVSLLRTSLPRFSKIDVDGFFLEFDDERSGGFEPLRHVTPGKKVVLGLVSSKVPELEKKDALKRRIEQASKVVPMENLCLSPQCGFSSTHHGNNLTVEQEKAKLRLCLETAKEVWG